MRWIHGDIGFTPPDAVFGFGITNDELVFGRTSGVRTGFHHQWAILCQYAFVISQCSFDQWRSAQIAVQRRICRETLLRK